MSTSEEEGRASEPPTIWRIDEHDIISFVNEEWDRFALANDGHAAMSACVLGRSLWDFVVDPTTRQIYAQLLGRVRAGHPVAFTLRCDGPTERRLLAMELSPMRDDGVEFRTRLLERHSRPPQVLPSPSHDTSARIRVCSWCERIFIDGAWLEIEDALPRLQVLEHARIPAMTHGICAECRQRMLRTIAPQRIGRT